MRYIETKHGGEVLLSPQRLVCELNSMSGVQQLHQKVLLRLTTPPQRLKQKARARL